MLPNVQTDVQMDGLRCRLRGSNSKQEWSEEICQIFVKMTVNNSIMLDVLSGETVEETTQELFNELKFEISDV